MKEFSSAFADHLAGRVTTLAHCWTVTRSDGVVLGFTDHDRSLTVDGVSCTPENALEATAMTVNADLSTGGGEVSGSLSSVGLTEADLEAGLWDGAEVRAYTVNWQSPEDFVLLRRAHIGEVTREGAAFRAELRGLAHLLEGEEGRVFSHACDADLGETRCGIDLTDSAYCAEGILIGAADRASLLVSGLEDYEAGWFSGGRLTLLDGDLAGFAAEIATHAEETGGTRLRLWLEAPQKLATGTRVQVTAGCDKRFATCCEKFANGLNFQGFPHMPGTDFVLSYPTHNTAKNDGSALVS